MSNQVEKIMIKRNMCKKKKRKRYTDFSDSTAEEKALLDQCIYICVFLFLD